MFSRIHILFEYPIAADMAAGELSEWLGRWFLDEDYEVSVEENLVVLRDKKAVEPPEDEEPEEPMGWVP